MNSNVSRRTGMTMSMATDTATATITRWKESGRLAILLGWLVSMFGIVLYCLATLNGGTDHETPTLLDGGWKGQMALLLLVMGVLLWLYGAVKSLWELEQQETQGGNDGGNDWGATF